MGVGLCNYSGKAVNINEPSKKLTYSFYEAGSKALNEQQKNWLKALRYTGFFVGEAMGKAPDSLVQFCSELGNIKNLRSTLDIYNNFPKAYRVFFPFSLGANESAPRESVGTIFKNAIMEWGKLYNDFADAVEVSSVYVSLLTATPLNMALCAFVKRSNWGVTGLCASINAVKEWNAFYKAERAVQPEQQVLSVLRLAMHVSYAAFAVISITSFVTGAAVSSMTIVSCLASGTLFGLLSFFYEQMNDPYGKNYEEYKKLEGRIQLAS